MSPADEVVIHGHRVSFRRAGSGPCIVLLHGITGSSRTWDEVIPPLAERHTVIAPDLLGHGESAKPRGDYSLGAYASGVRDLLIALGIEKATVVGHSLGGGVAMQFAYQFPDRVDRLVLVSSGGLGEEVHLLLRAATLPAAEYVLPVLCAQPLRDAGATVARLVGRVGLRPGSDLEEMARGFASLGDMEARQAFVHTVRGIMDIGGQRVSARDRLYLAASVPTLLVWGERDRMIPVAHGRAGHFPHRDHPWRFAADLLEFVQETEPAVVDEDEVRLLMQHR
jgi:pimeloyl-ACP methyl ester carboxylesterase